MKENPGQKIVILFDMSGAGITNLVSEIGSIFFQLTSFLLFRIMM
jgi:hypothetical protein